MQRMDYERLLRQSRAAFDDGDENEGLRLLELAAIFERRAPDASGDSVPPAA